MPYFFARTYTVPCTTYTIRKYFPIIWECSWHSHGYEGHYSLRLNRMTAQVERTSRTGSQRRSRHISVMLVYLEDGVTNYFMCLSDTISSRVLIINSTTNYNIGHIYGKAMNYYWLQNGQLWSNQNKLASCKNVGKKKTKICRPFQPLFGHIFPF